MPNENIDVHDENENVVNEAHDMKNAEKQSVDATDKAGNATGRAKARKGDKSNSEPMQKLPSTKAGMVSVMVNKLTSMDRAGLKDAYFKLVGEGVEGEEANIEEDFDVDVADAIEANFDEELGALIEEEATLSEEFKGKAKDIFEAAFKSQVRAEVSRLEEAFQEELEEEVNQIRENLVEKIDGFLNYVVEQWMEENELAIEQGLRTEIAENFMNGLKGLFEENFIEVPDSKIELVDELAEQVEELSEKLNNTTATVIALSEENEVLKRSKVILEACDDLSDTQVEKLESLVEDIEFDDEETFREKVSNIKETYFKKSKPTGDKTIVEETSSDDDGAPLDLSEEMNAYVSALRGKNL